MTDSKKIPRMLLVGAGRFGMQHLRVLRDLEKAKKVRLVGVVVKSKKTKAAIETQYAVPVFTAVTPKLLKQVDAVDIVTPAATHLTLIKQCLPHAHVFVEKPIVQTAREIAQLRLLQAKYDHLIMVGHIYRFNPLVQRLKKIITELGSSGWAIAGDLTKPLVDDTHQDPTLEFLHHVDVLDYLFGSEPTARSKRIQGRVHELSLRYPGTIDATLRMGWIGTERKNRMTFSFGELLVVCDFLTNMITIQRGDSKESVVVQKGTEPLESELSAFITAITNSSKKMLVPNAEVGIRVVEACGEPIHDTKTPTARKKVAIIGAGIFGTTTALELAHAHDVTVFERNNDILTEASFVNQYRHHWGYHYPRSSETVTDIRKATADFEEMFDSAIIRNFPTYYAVAKEGSKVSAEEYLAFCDAHNLPYEIQSPGSEFIDEKKISLSLKTLEPIYDYSKLRNIIRERLKKTKNVTLKFSSPVIGGYLGNEGKKVVMYQENGVMRTGEFDYVINITYANYNLFASWFNFMRKKIRVDLVEALIMRIPLPRMSFAIMDGPFTNVVPTEHENIFTLVHIKESVLHRFVPSDGLIPPGLTYVSNAKKIIEESMRWLPILKNAEYLESRYVFRSVNAGREYDDARPSDITYHGFGCWSVLGGKIVNCVTTAKQIASDIAKDL